MPTHEKALRELIAIHEGGSKPVMESVFAHLPKGAANFMKTGIELELEQYVNCTWWFYIHSHDDYQVHATPTSRSRGQQ